MKFKAVYFTFLFYSVKLIFAASMRELIQTKYSRNDPDLKFLRFDSRKRLDRFEEDSTPAFTDNNLFKFLIEEPMKTYKDDAISKQIIEKCLENGPPPEVICEIIRLCVEYDLEELFDEVLDQFDPKFIEVFDRIEMKVAVSGKFSYAKKLMIKGIRCMDPNFIIYLATLFKSETQIDELKDVYDFLIVKRQEIDVNEPIGPYEPKEPVLHLLLKTGYDRAYLEKMAKYLISIGADPNCKDYNGESAVEVAQELGILLSES